MAKPIREQIIDYLVNELKCVEVESTSRKYRKFSIGHRPGVFWWVGKMGGLRYGSGITNSTSCTDQILRKLKNGWI
jgi:hypothetical protein